MPNRAAKEEASLVRTDFCDCVPQRISFDLWSTRKESLTSHGLRQGDENFRVAPRGDLDDRVLRAEVDGSIHDRSPAALPPNSGREDELLRS